MSSRLIFLAVLFIAVIAPRTSFSHTPLQAPYGIEHRVPWINSAVVGSPEPPAPFVTRKVFVNLPSERVLDLRPAPGSKRLYVVDAEGRIRSFAPGKSASQVVTVLPPGKGQIYAIAFHPAFAKNRFMFVYGSNHAQRPPHFQLRRFTLNKDGVASLKTEQLILDVSQNDHFGGSIHFGPDGFLYMGLGDGGGIGDPTSTGQDISDLRASILRIDVDHPSNGLPYGIPSDNPFIATKGARPEVWSFGIRNPWRFSFDPPTGDLWVGDVGQDLWEMIEIARKGSNHGWSLREGTHGYHSSRKQGPSPVVPPIIEHPHSEARSITGGFVYRGKRFAELQGAYIYGDYDTGMIWALRWDGKKVTWKQTLVDTSLRVVAFGHDAANELYILSYDGSIHQLERAAAHAPHPAFPKLLSQTGLFSSTKDHVPAAGVIPYDVVAPLWSDNAHKERFVALPGKGKIDVQYKPRWDEPEWGFPEGAVLVKTFALELEEGKPASRKRLETRLWTLQDGHWQGYTYAWNDNDSDAVLVGAEGANRQYTIKDSRQPSGVRTQDWHFPSRAECSLCHTMPAGFVLGFRGPQLDTDRSWNNGPVDNQLRTFEHLGYFSRTPKRAENQARLVDYHDRKNPIESRARSYLHGNCAHCHRPFGGGYASFKLDIEVPLEKMGVLNAWVERGASDLADARVVSPGHPEQSVLLSRMETLGPERMPSVASALVDPIGIEVIRQWIAQMPIAP